MKTNGDSEEVCEKHARNLTEPIRYTGRRIGRNEKCPCGSGKKYKNCHMREHNASGAVVTITTRTVEVPAGTVPKLDDPRIARIREVHREAVDSYARLAEVGQVNVVEEAGGSGGEPGLDTPGDPRPGVPAAG